MVAVARRSLSEIGVDEDEFGRKSFPAINKP